MSNTFNTVETSVLTLAERNVIAAQGLSLAEIDSMCARNFFVASYAKGTQLRSVVEPIAREAVLKELAAIGKSL